jgi:hypothetical protein
MVYLQTKNPNLGTLWSVLESKILLYFTAIWSVFNLVYLLALWYLLWSFGIFSQILYYVVPRKIWQPCSNQEGLALDFELRNSANPIFCNCRKKMFRVSKNELFFAGIEPMYTYNGHKSFA